MEKIKRIYRCDPGIDGIFTAIYDAWDSRYGHSYIKIEENNAPVSMELFAEYIETETSAEKAEKVAGTIQNKISAYAYEVVIKSALSIRKGRADAIYRFLQLGLSVGENVMDQLSHPYVLPLFEMERRVNFEIMRYKQFLRFTERTGGILFARIRPENNILTLVTPHFEDRLPEENFIIFDEGRKTAAIHKRRFPFIIADGRDLDLSAFEDYSDAELDMQYFWKTFVDTIGIEERFNEKLQHQMLPNRYREFMPEIKYKK